MSGIQGIGRIKLHEGALAEFTRLGARIMEIVRTKDTRTLQFEVYFNDDQSECIVLERYKDYKAFIEHGAHVGDLAAAFPTMGSVSAACLATRAQSCGHCSLAAGSSSSRPICRCRWIGR